MNLNAWNAGLTLALLALGIWFDTYGLQAWRQFRSRCVGCGRERVSCSCSVNPPWEE